jgi:replicative DNA helicase
MATTSPQAPKRASNAAPPQNNEAEASLLGALLIDTDAIVKVADSIADRDFYDPKHQKIYQAGL